MILKHIAPISLGKMLGGLYAILGLIGGIFFAIIAEGIQSMLMLFPPDTPFHIDEGNSISLVILLVLPLVYGGIGFISGALIAAVYNWIAELFGGIELEFVQADEPDEPNYDNQTHDGQTYDNQNYTDENNRGVSP